jgi:hypothetical protein
MAWKIQHLPDQEIILVKNTGHQTYQDYVERIRELVALSEEIKVFRILSDNTEMNADIGTMDIYEFPKLYRELGLSFKCKIALLISTEEPEIDDFKFYETVCLNRGYRSRIFFLYEDALEWLKG